MPSIPQARRRWFGLLYLILAAGLLIWGLTVLRPLLRGWLFIVYWVACFVLTLLAIGVAWLDLRSIRRQAREDRNALLKRTVEELSRDLQEKEPSARHDEPNRG